VKSLRYGDSAIETLIETALLQGASRQRLRAKIFGGGMVLRTGITEPAMNVGERNVSMTRQFLADQGIAIVRELVLGVSGMMVKMLSSTGDVWVRRIGERFRPEDHLTEDGEFCVLPAGVNSACKKSA
jgi:chemotaxis receptor (MCP) glutamine deamidase CheD